MKGTCLRCRTTKHSNFSSNFEFAGTPVQNVHPGGRVIDGSCVCNSWRGRRHTGSRSHGGRLRYGIDDLRRKVAGNYAFGHSSRQPSGRKACLPNVQSTR
eukprot:scaffold24636_cov31-Tisochrysis_lutea.AAC.11